MLTSNPCHADARYSGQTERRGGTVCFPLPGVSLLVQDDEGIEQVLRHVNRRAAFHSEDEYRLAERRPLARTGDWTSHEEVRDAASALEEHALRGPRPRDWAEIQTRLKVHGFYHGTVDGKDSQTLSRAIIAFTSCPAT